MNAGSIPAAGTMVFNTRILNNKKHMKLTESKLRSIIREEMQDLYGAERYIKQFQRYFSEVGSGSGREFMLNGYTFVIQPMDSLGIEVSMYKDGSGGRPVASATIKDEAVEYYNQMGGSAPQSDIYRHPGPVVKNLQSMAK